mgnify:CR=1 FL=1
MISTTTENMNKGGIYAILTNNGECKYVGCTNLFSKRWYEHKTTLKSNKHSNAYLQQAWNLYGEDSIIFIILELCSGYMNMLDREDYWTKKMSPDCNIVYGQSGKSNIKAPSLRRSIKRFKQD